MFDLLETEMEICNKWMERYGLYVKLVGYAFTLQSINHRGHVIYTAPMTIEGLIYLCTKAGKLCQDIYRELPTLK